MFEICKLGSLLVGEKCLVRMDCETMELALLVCRCGFALGVMSCHGLEDASPPFYNF